MSGLRGVRLNKFWGNHLLICNGMYVLEQLAHIWILRIYISCCKPFWYSNSPLGKMSPLPFLTHTLQTTIYKFGFEFENNPLPFLNELKNFYHSLYYQISSLAISYLIQPFFEKIINMCTEIISVGYLYRVFFSFVKI